MVAMFMVTPPVRLVDGDHLRSGTLDAVGGSISFVRHDPKRILNILKNGMGGVEKCFLINDDYNNTRRKFTNLFAVQYRQIAPGWIW